MTPMTIIQGILQVLFHYLTTIIFFEKSPDSQDKEREGKGRDNVPVC